jgi:hypothetical protein
LTNAWRSRTREKLGGQLSVWTRHYDPRQ